jgi:predicted aminopeptidase
MVKKYWKWALLILVGVLLIVFGELIIYGIGQGKGQFKVLWNAVSLEEVLANPNLPDSTRRKLELIQEVRKFGEEELGINPSQNYTTYFDQEGKDILWMVTVCPPYSLEPKKWNFPFIGSFGYKGFFDLEKAKKERKKWIDKGYDTDLRVVAGWSTLGVFKDPILSSMLLREDAELINLILHELTHGTVFIKDSTTLNENLASFIGDQGAIRFLRKYKSNMPELIEEYEKRKKDKVIFQAYTEGFSRKLDSLYKSWGESIPENAEELKADMIAEYFEGLLDLPTDKSSEWRVNLIGYGVNHAYFMSFMQYRGNQDDLTKQLEEEFGGDLREFLSWWKEKHPKF